MSNSILYKRRAAPATQLLNMQWRTEKGVLHPPPKLSYLRGTKTRENDDLAKFISFIKSTFYRGDGNKKIFAPSPNPDVNALYATALYVCFFCT